MEFRLPTLPHTQTVTLARWRKQAGEPIVAPETLLEVYSADFDWDIPAPCDGTLQAIHAQAGAQVATGDVLAVISEQSSVNVADNAESSVNSKSLFAIHHPPSAISHPPSATAHPARVEGRPTPVAARILAAHTLDVARTQGTGVAGRITKADVLTLLNADQRHATRDERRASHATSDKQYPISNIQYPRSSLFIEIDMTHVLEQCDDHQAVWQRREGFVLTPLPFIVLATVSALKALPIISSLPAPDGVRLRSACDVVVAGHLITHADNYNLLGLARRLQCPASTSDMPHHAFVVRARGLSPDDESTTPLLYTTWLASTAAASLTLGAWRKRVVVVNDALAIRSQMYVGLTFDARIIDEALAETFLSHLKESLERSARR
jgi:pyruvate/2-oxoglutarate dehydrogenase complex dihydrolipoamide acyltransferase (E2) component